MFSIHPSLTSERVDIDAYTVVDLAASWKLTRSLELTGRISNLLDEEYEEVLGFVRPGRACMPACADVSIFRICRSFQWPATVSSN